MILGVRRVSRGGGGAMGRFLLWARGGWFLLGVLEVCGDFFKIVF